MKKTVCTICINLVLTILIIVVYHNYKIAPYLKTIDKQDKIEDDKIDLKFSTIEDKVDYYLLTKENVDNFMQSFFNADISGISQEVDDNITVSNDGLMMDNDPDTLIPYSWTNDKYSYKLYSYSYDEAEESLHYVYRVYNKGIPQAFMNLNLEMATELWKVHYVEIDI